MELSTTTPAKINLSLRLTGKRSDGYNNIETVFMPLFGLVDTVRVKEVKGDGITVKCDVPGVPEDSENLCWKAATRFAENSGVTACWHIEIEKNIPVAAGLGGGSSDAAAVISLLNEMYDKPLNENTLHCLASGIGADVAFFLEPAPAIGKGRGDELETVECAMDLPLVLINPGVPVSAAWAYTNCYTAYNDEMPTADDVAHQLLEGGSTAAISGMLRNDLESAIARKYLIVNVIKEFLAEKGCSASLVSGSGPTVFGLCSSVSQAQRIQADAEAYFGESFSFWSGLAPGNCNPHSA